MLRTSMILYEEMLRLKLARDARNLAKDLIHLADGLQSGGIRHLFNTLGEVQGRGSAIDNLCGELGAYQKILGLLEKEKDNDRKD